MKEATMKRFTIGLLLAALALPGLATNKTDQFNLNYWQYKPVTLTGYLKADGTVPLTAAWDAGEYGITSLNLTADPTWGTEVIAGFASWTPTTNWTYSGHWSHATGSATALTATGETAIVANTLYKIVITSTTSTAGRGVVFSMGGVSMTAISATGTFTYYIYTTATTAPAFTPGTGGTWVGTIDSISIKPHSSGGTLTTNYLYADGPITRNGTVPMLDFIGKERHFTTLSGAGGNEDAFVFNYTVNKVTGDDVGLKIVQTATSVPGDSYLMKFFVGDELKVGFSSLGNLYNNGTFIHIYGSTTAYLRLYDSYFGLESANVFQYGKDAAAPAAQTIKGSDATGDDHAGGSFTISGGRGTDTGAGGSVKIQTAPAGAAGSNAGTLIDRVEVDSTGTVRHLGVNSQSTNIEQATVAVTTTAAATATATNLIPAGAMVVGVTTRVTTAVTGDAGFTGFDIGHSGTTVVPADKNAYGDNVSPSLNETTDISDSTVASPLNFITATNIVLTQRGGSTFVAGGVVRITVHYISLTAPST
jgi:hypothetical protein